MKTGKAFFEIYSPVKLFTQKIMISFDQVFH